MLSLICFLELLLLSIPFGSFAHTIDNSFQQRPALDVLLKSRAVDAADIEASDLDRRVQPEGVGKINVHGSAERRSSIPVLHARQDENLTATPTTAAEFTNTDVYPFDVTWAPIPGLSFYFELEGELYKNLDVHVELLVHFVFSYKIGVYDGNLEDGIDMKVNLGFVKADLRLFLEHDGDRSYATVEVSGQVRVIGKGWVQFHKKKRLFRVLLVDGFGASTTLSTNVTSPSLASPKYSVYSNPTGVPTS